MLRFGVRATDCLIKGNITSSGERIYHVPGQRYDKTLRAMGTLVLRRAKKPSVPADEK